MIQSFDEVRSITSPEKVIIFSSLLLPPSQTFVKGLGEQLENFAPLYVGSRFTPGLSLPPEMTLVVNRGGLRGSVAELGFKLWGIAPNLVRQLQEVNPVLINAQFGLSGALALPLAKKLQIPLIVHFRGADATVKAEVSRYTSLNHWLFFRRMKALQEEAALFIAVSEFIKGKLLELGFPEEKVIVHYEGIDLEQFKPDSQIRREPIVLFVGRLTEKKGCGDLIRAMARVQAVIPDLELVVLGDGPLLTELKTQASQQLRRYQFLGMQPPEVVQKWMNKAYLLCNPSIKAPNGDSEGLGMVFVEAQAMGLPVVSTRHGGIPEAMQEGKTGFLVPERDWEQLSESILKLFTEPILWQHFTENAQSFVHSKFDRRKQSQGLEEIYHTVLRQHQFFKDV
ncbi:glycosyltransferase [Merismopedia glauca]|uniref:Glycosyl transferase n=1 Tax=Merismopedia glauca CCAP 1448/3 TaxID=1296344 RepID=A0A2T1BYM0_9CYAN|nr:glycosyltransferase [Merismopedia glauca]PSB01130.1 glycosyl transferase [Merismopedia glauca CCAP 1448/3]